MFIFLLLILLYSLPLNKEGARLKGKHFLKIVKMVDVLSIEIDIVVSTRLPARTSNLIEVFRAYHPSVTKSIFRQLFETLILSDHSYD